MINYCKYTVGMPFIIRTFNRFDFLLSIRINSMYRESDANNMTLRTMILFCLIFNLSAVKFAFCDENVMDLHNFYSNRNYSTVKCIHNILTKYFPCGTLTTFINHANVDQLIKTTNEAEICHSIIVRSFDDQNWYIWTNVYVITVEDLFGLWSGLLDISRDVFWNPRAKFIIQMNNIVGGNEGIQTLFKTLLKYRMYDVVLLENGEDDAVIYTYHPFENHSCGKYFDKVITLGSCESAGNITNYFPNKIPHEMTNCTFKVVATDDIPNFISKSSNYTVYGKFVSGLEQYVLDTIAEREGFFLDYETFGDNVPNGIVLSNRTATGLLYFISNGKADIAAGGYVLMKNRVELFDYLWGFNYAAYYLYTPAHHSHIWHRVYGEFGTITWLLIFAAIFYVIVVGELLKKRLRDKTFSVLYLWGYFFGNAGRGLSRNKKFRMIIMLWAIFTFCITSFYNTALFSIITIHVHEKTHSISVEDLKTLPYAPCISDNTRMFFQYAYNQSLPEGQAILNCTSTDSALQYVSNTKNHYAIEMEGSYELKEYEYLDKVCKPELDSWLFSGSNMIVMYLVRGFPFADKFQEYAHRLYEAGLIMNHLKTINLRSYTVIHRHPKAFTATKLLDLRIHFGTLLVGYILSFLCFLLEIWYNYIREERKFKRMVTVNNFKRKTDGQLLKKNIK